MLEEILHVMEASHNETKLLQIRVYSDKHTDLSMETFNTIFPDVSLRDYLISQIEHIVNTVDINKSNINKYVDMPKTSSTHLKETVRMKLSYYTIDIYCVSNIVFGNEYKINYGY